MQLTLPILIGIALADSLNLVSFGVLEKLISSAATKKKLEPKVAGKQYILGFVITYVVIGLVGILVLSMLGTITSATYSVIGAIIFLLGLLEANRVLKINTKLFKTLSEPEIRVNAYIEEFIHDPSLSYALGVSTALREMLYTGGFYVGLLALLAIQGAAMDQYMTIFFYNLIVGLPLIIIYLNLIKNGQAKEFQPMEITKRRNMMLGVASLQTVLGIWLMFWWFV